MNSYLKCQTTNRPQKWRRCGCRESGNPATPPLHEFAAFAGPTTPPPPGPGQRKHPMQTQTTRPDLTEYANKLIHHKACKLVGKAGYIEGDVEDIKHDLIVDLLERLPKFDPTKARYNTFVARVVERKICNLIRDRRAARRDRRREECSLNEDVDAGEGDELHRTATLDQDDHEARCGKHRRPAEDRHQLRLDIDAVMADLSPDLRRAVELLRSMPINQVAREMGISRPSFYENHLTRLRDAFAAKGLDGYLA